MIDGPVHRQADDAVRAVGGVPEPDDFFVLCGQADCA
jgi:hypothetical protein